MPCLATKRGLRSKRTPTLLLPVSTLTEPYRKAISSNLAFVLDLQLLADVVARRTMCDGPGKKVAETGKRLTVERQAVDDALAVLDRQKQQQPC